MYEGFMLTLGHTIAEYGAYLVAVSVTGRLLTVASSATSKSNSRDLVVAVVVSSFGKPLHIFLMVWNYQHLFSTILDVFVVVSNITAVRALVNDTKKATVMVSIGLAVRLLTRLALSWHGNPTVPFTLFVN